MKIKMCMWNGNMLLIIYLKDEDKPEIMSGANTGKTSQQLPLLGAKIQAPKFKKVRKTNI